MTRKTLAALIASEETAEQPREGAGAFQHYGDGSKLDAD
jgi:hypothetical protein